MNLLYVISGVAVLILTVMWVVLPVIILSKFNELLKLQRETVKQLRSAHEHLAAMRRYYEPAPTPPSAVDAPGAELLP